MSTIPPNWLGSIIQTQGAQTRAVGDKQSASAAQAERTGDGFAEKLQDVIEETDRDSQVYSDAEGSGSQGRPSDTPPPEEELAAEDTSPPDTGGGGLDLQA
ncbi:MAG: hypothetical protein KA383_02605 [Phycisphaerae bacterium]|nr:hypothetical protein [Phycisphaerae bacterium]